MSATPKILLPALRQYRHNTRGDNSLFAGFDYDETLSIVTKLQEEIARLKEALNSIEAQPATLSGINLTEKD